MIKTYHFVQQWNDWVRGQLGATLLETEKDFLNRHFSQHYGQYALLLGVPNQHVLIEKLPFSMHIVLSPLINRNKNIQYIEGSYKELPIASGCADFVVLPHTLEFLDNPRQLLNEACRIVRPEGKIVIFCFNHYSLWGLSRWLSNHKEVPWSANTISANQVKLWLSLADFQLINHEMLMFRPPISSPSLLKKLAFLEFIGNKTHAFFGGVYAITAQAKVIPLTPIKLHWKQQISTVQASLGSSMRDMP